MAAVLVVLVPRRVTGAPQVRLAQFQRVVRVHGRRPAHMRRPTARVPVRVPGRRRPVRRARVHGRPDQLRRPDHRRLGQTVSDESARRLLSARRRPGRVRVRRGPGSLPAAGRQRRAPRLRQIHQNATGKRRPCPVRTPFQRQHYVRAIRDFQVSHCIYRL